MSATGAGPPEEEVHTDRWRRRLGSGDALSTNEALRLSEAEAARIAERAKLAAQTSESVSASDRVSISRVDESTKVPEAPAPATSVASHSLLSDSAPADSLLSDSAPMPPPPTGSPLRLGPPPELPEVERLTVDEFSVPEVDVPEVDGGGAEATDTIDLTDAIDLRMSATTPDATTPNATTNDELHGDEDLVSVAGSSTRAASLGQTESLRQPGRPASDGGDDDGDWPSFDISEPGDQSESDSAGETDTAAESGSPLPPEQRPQHAELSTTTAIEPVFVPEEPLPRRSRSAGVLLVVAAGLAVLSGVLGALWMQERSEGDDLADQLNQAKASDAVTVQGLDDINDEARTLQLENERLQQQLNDMSALVLELPEGRVTEIAVPFTPAFADEENGRLIAISEEGEYITWGEGADGPVTDSGSVSGPPNGLFAATRKAWVSTEEGQIDALSLVAGEPGLPSVDVGPTRFLAPEEKAYWAFNSTTGEVVRRKKSDSSVTAAVAIPVDVVDLTIGAGSVWALGDDGRVYRINTADFTVAPVDAGTDLISITASPDALWTLSAADGSLRRIDPVSGEVLVTVPVGRDPIDATFAGESVWVALRLGSSLIEVNTLTAAVVSRTPLPGEPAALHTGDSGVFVTTDSEEVPLLRVSSLTTVATEVEGATEDADAEDTTEATNES